MSYYTDDDLKDFVKYSTDYLAGLKKDENKKSTPEEEKALSDFTKIIVSMYYNAMLFESFITGHSANDYIMSKDMQQLPLHMNDDGLVSQVIVKWRLQRNK
jgi:hypothetical protein